jgi:ubiquinone/menaquinone biosynthesis C-methylase UbiE
MKTSNNTNSGVDPRIAFFDRLADEWDCSEQDQGEIINEMNGRAELLGLQPGECVLEIGCGTGQLTGWLADRVQPGRVVGMDFSSEMLRKAKSKNIPATFRLADVCQDDLGDSEFDLALCFHSFPHFRDQAAALRNLARCLKPGGRLVVIHLKSRDAINMFHHHVGGTVGGDFLPDDVFWNTSLVATGFQKPEIDDAPNGFFLRAKVAK